MAKELMVKKAEVPTPWRPFMDFERWERDAERMMNQLFIRTMMPWWPQGGLRSDPMAINAPSVDLYVNKDEVVIKADLPGMEKDDIEVNLSDHSLTLKGEKKRKERVKEENYFYAERTYGCFERTLEVPVDVQGEKVKASITHGVLEIRLPIAQSARVKSINVKIEEGPATTIGQD